MSSFMFKTVAEKKKTKQKKQTDAKQVVKRDKSGAIKKCRSDRRRELKKA